VVPAPAVRRIVTVRRRLDDAVTALPPPGAAPDDAGADLRTRPQVLELAVPLLLEEMAAG